jgi:L-threonylcarbamoyladenylate synthase
MFLHIIRWQCSQIFLARTRSRRFVLPNKRIKRDRHHAWCPQFFSKRYFHYFPMDINELESKVETKILRVDPKSFKDEDLAYAVKLLQDGEVVAFPTETVYGLGANALNADASKKIFVVKGRPPDNPLIVHVCSIEMLKSIVADVPENAKVLIEKFWPAPLTILFKTNGKVSDVVTCGQPTVAVRMPSHPVALRLIELCKLPIAAPSANLSGRPSPTTAEHVKMDLEGRIKCIIDSGQCSVGVESTVVDLNRDPPLILRPGGITLEQLRPYIPTIEVYNKVIKEEDLLQTPPTPGLKYKHYAPKAEVILFEGPVENMKPVLFTHIDSLLKQNKKVGLIHTHPDAIQIPEAIAKSSLFVLKELGSESNPKAIAQGLFSVLRELDEQGVNVIVMEGISEQHEGLAVMNRIRKAAAHIIHV